MQNAEHWRRSAGHLGCVFTEIIRGIEDLFNDHF